MDNATIATIIGSLLGVLITTFGNIAIALIASKSRKETDPPLLVPAGYESRRPQTRILHSPRLWVSLGAFALLATLFSVLLVYLFGLNAAAAPNLVALQTIQFDYSDSPLDHGWDVFDGNAEQITFENIADATVGKAVKISSPTENFYAIDYNINQVASELGDYLELVSRFDGENASLYVYVNMIRSDGSETQDGWLKLKPGKYRFAPSQQSQYSPEWLVFITPVLLPNSSWIKLQIDLRKCVQDTFGVDGWEFAIIRKFRMRGNISIDSITIYQSIPK